MADETTVSTPAETTVTDTSTNVEPTVPLDCEDWNRIVKWVYKFYEVLRARNF